jgi:hypothetical protein
MAVASSGVTAAAGQLNSIPIAAKDSKPVVSALDPRHLIKISVSIFIESPFVLIQFID